MFGQVLSRDLLDLDPGPNGEILQYVDDLLICSPDEKSSQQHAIQVLNFLAERGHLTTRGSPIKYGDQILRLLEAVHLPTKVSVSHCKGHQKGSTEVAQGNQAADQAAKRAALQNQDLIGVASLVPQTNLPETPSYTDGETLKAKSEGFQEDHMG